MADYQHDNPYASPQFAAEPADMSAAETIGVWRDGDELVMLMARVKPPKACWVTNRRGFVLLSPIVSDSPAVAVPLLLLHVPGIGIILSIAAAVVLQIRGQVPSFPTLGYLSPRLWIVRLAIAGLVTLSLMAGLAVSALALVVWHPWLTLLLVPAAVVQVLVYYYRDRMHLGLAGRPAGDGMVRVRGVHPDYLGRLPQFAPEEVAVSRAKIPRIRDQLGI
ncbi:MAG: hypothetical protein GXX96_08940 [Planctomycetaceae bacterium]|nr:hypothetical protein [Planctomycetaceae bacterium]